MSLEIALQENTKAVLALVALMQANGNSAKVNTTAAKNETQKLEADKPAEKPAAKPKDEAQKTEPQAVTYEEIRKAGLEITKAPGKGRQVLLEVLAKMGLTTAQEAKPEQYPALLKAFQDALAS